MYKINCKQMINFMYHTSEDNKSRFKQQESTFVVVTILLYKILIVLCESI